MVRQGDEEQPQQQTGGYGLGDGAGGAACYGLGGYSIHPAAAGSATASDCTLPPRAIRSYGSTMASTPTLTGSNGSTESASRRYESLLGGVDGMQQEPGRQGAVSTLRRAIGATVVLVMFAVGVSVVHDYSLTAAHGGRSGGVAPGGGRDDLVAVGRDEGASPAVRGGDGEFAAIDLGKNKVSIHKVRGRVVYGPRHSVCSVLRASPVFFYTCFEQAESVFTGPYYLH